MSEKYKAIRASGMYVGTSGEVRVTEATQLDRLEKKVDRILHILENGELSTSLLGTRNVHEVGESLYKPIRAKQV